MITYQQFLTEEDNNKTVFDSPEDAYEYVIYICLGKRYPPAEPYIIQDPSISFLYAQNILKDRFPEGENTIRKHNDAWKSYLWFLRRKSFTRETKWQWLHEKVNENLVRILNYIGMNIKMQDYICRTRPDLISKIQYLRRDLRAKYKDELDLSKIDI